MQRLFQVRIICELDSVGDGQIYAGKTADGGKIIVRRDQRSPFPTTKFVEFIGMVLDGSTLQEESNSNFGDSFDMGMHNEAVVLMSTKHRALFYS